MANLKGFTPPFSPTGKSALVPEFPWYYSSDLTMFTYRTDPDRVIEWLPDPLEPADDPGMVGIVFADFQSCYGNFEELVDPVRSQYKECWIVLAAKYRGQPVAHQILAWVDKDFSLMRGMVQGFNKKFGSVYMTRPVRAGKAGPRLERGAKFGATLAANDRRLLEARLTLTKTTDAPLRDPAFVPFAPLCLIRRFPSVVPSASPLINEMVRMQWEDIDMTEIWEGEAEVRLFDSPTEDLMRIAPHGVIKGYWTSRGLKIVGGDVLEQYGATHALAGATAR